MQRDGKIKPVLLFEEDPRGLVLNGENKAALIDRFGRETNNWLGKRITLLASQVRDPNGATQGIRFADVPTDCEDVLAAEWLRHQGINVSPPTVAPAVVAAAKDTPYHPVREYLGGLEWDGRNRLESLAKKYLGVDDSSYAALVGKCMLVAAVARIMEPGCKADHIVILEGEQGTLKSTALEVMFRPYFSDDLSDARHQRCADADERRLVPRARGVDQHAARRR